MGCAVFFSKHGISALLGVMAMSLLQNHKGQFCTGSAKVLFGLRWF
jgi:hypothetical protein